MPVIRVEMTDLDVVEHVAAMFSRTVQRNKQRDPGHKLSFSTTVKGATAAHYMRLLRPVLGARRQTQVDTALARPHNEEVRWLRREAICTVAGCARPGLTRTLCKHHYSAWWKSRKRGQAPAYTPRGPALPEAMLAIPGPGHPGAIHWLAGLLEGEGNFTNSGGYPVIKVSMCDRDVIARAAELLGGQAIWEVNDARARERGWSPGFATGLGGARGAELMRTVQPLMGTRRQAAIDHALEQYAPVRLTRPPERCIVDGCERRHRSRGLCNTHYMMWSRDRASGRKERLKALR